MAELIHFDPQKTPGTEELSPSGKTIRYVPPEEYFAALLGEVMNVTVVFLHANTPGLLSPEQQRSVDDRIAEEYWGKYLGCLMPRRVLRAIARIAKGPSGEILLEEIEDMRRAIFEASTIGDAVEVHASCRIQMVLRGAEGMFTDEQASLGELIADYLLVQRGIAEDVRRAEKERGAGETRASVLARLDRSADLQFELVLSQVLHPKRAYQMIPKSRKRELERFAQIRRPLHQTGVLSDGTGAESL